MLRCGAEALRRDLWRTGVRWLANDNHGQHDRQMWLGRRGARGLAVRASRGRALAAGVGRFY